MYKATEDQKESLYHDGFVVLSNIVPEAATSAAKSTIYRELGSLRNASVQKSLNTINTGTKEEIMNLVEPNSILHETIRTLLGPINPLSAGQWPRLSLHRQTVKLTNPVIRIMKHHFLVGTDILTAYGMGIHPFIKI